MNYQVLARKLRPQKFEDVIGQNSIVTSITNAIETNKIAHAYLFSGTRGVGKTTLARLIAKSLSCENLGKGKTPYDPCLNCPSCRNIHDDTSMDVVEIDGASNNSVENIRDLVDNIQYLPVSSKYRIYIIDEVHMLTTNAFNALLKTLEEPPAHVIFIMATTEPHKLLPTVISRCQRYDFKSVTENELSSFLENVFKKEEITLSSKTVLKQICLKAAGSVRDALSIVEQILSYCTAREIDEDVLSHALGLAKETSINELLGSIFNNDPKTCSEIYRQLLQDNIELKSITGQILESIYDIIHGTDHPIPLPEIFWIYEVLAKDFTWAISSLLPEKSTEIVLQKVALRRTFFKQNSDNKKKRTEVKPVVKTNLHKEDLSWDQFLKHLFDQSPVLASNLEQGNILNKLDPKADTIKIDIGFKNSSSIFHDYLKEQDVYSRLKQHAEDFFCKAEKQQILLTLSRIDNSLKDNFVSKAELREIKTQNKKEKKRDELINSPAIITAEKLFGTKISKINIKNKTKD